MFSDILFFHQPIIDDGRVGIAPPAVFGESLIDGSGDFGIHLRVVLQASLHGAVDDGPKVGLLGRVVWVGRDEDDLVIFRESLEEFAFLGFPPCLAFGRVDGFRELDPVKVQVEVGDGE